MKRYLVAFLAGLALSISAVIGLVAFAVGHAPDENALIMKAKLDRAAEIQKSKIVLIGGSNVRFGLSAKMIEEGTSVPTINLAHTGDLGLDYLLFLTRQALKPGDTVVMAFEYDWYDTDQMVTQVNARSALWNDIAWVRTLPLSEQLLWERNLSLRTIWGGLRERARPSQYRLPIGAFDAWGDQRGHEPTASSRNLLNAEGKPRPFVFNPQASTVRSVTQFLDWCLANDVEVGATWPVWAVNWVERDGFDPFIEKVRSLYTQRGGIILGEPSDALLTPDLPYHSVRHANSDGTRIRTENLIKAMLAIPNLRRGRSL